MDSRTHKKKEKRNLLIVYVDEKPELARKDGELFRFWRSRSLKPSLKSTRKRSDARTSVVQEHPNSKLNLFLIRKASDGQAQVALAESPTVNDVLAAAEAGNEPCSQNIPVITLLSATGMNFRSEEIPEVRDARPIAPYPDQIVRLLSNQWVRDGSSPIGANGKPQKAKQEVVGPGLGEVLALMFRGKGSGSRQRGGCSICSIHRVAPLLIGIFGAKHAYGPRHAQGRHEPFF